MKTFIDRRAFIKGGLALGAAGALGLKAHKARGAGAGSGPGNRAGADLAVSKDPDPFRSTRQALEALGGPEKYLGGGPKVGLLINHPFRNPGTFVNADVALAVAVMCLQAGAKEVRSLKIEPPDYWQRAAQAGRWPSEIKSIKPCSGEYVKTRIEKGTALKEGRIIRDLFEVDLLINVSITKDHEGTRYSGILKNMMGAATHSTCRFFHNGSGTPGWYGDLDHMDQCIADINLLRPPDLAVADATRFILTNGPFGPGKMAEPGLVLAGVDPVLVDAYGVGLLGLWPKEVTMIGRSEAAGLGRADLGRARVLKIEA